MAAKKITIAAVICAAGSSKRMGGVKKEYLRLRKGRKSQTVLTAAVAAFASCPAIGPIVISMPAVRKKDNAALSVLLRELCSIAPDCGERIRFVRGGPTRRASVYNALLYLEELKPSYVLIHDGARPWIKKTLIEKVISAAIQYGAAIPALPMTETPKELSYPLKDKSVPAGNYIKRHLRRTDLCVAQTPQGFKFPELLEAHGKAEARAAKKHIEYTDDAEIWGEFTGKVAVIQGDPGNRKITYPEDIAIQHKEKSKCKE